MFCIFDFNFTFISILKRGAINVKFTDPMSILKGGIEKRFFFMIDEPLQRFWEGGTQLEEQTVAKD